jgi:molecular chaperone DnaK (HSP70)
MPRYSIGIDLGTSNCALSYIDLEGSAGKTQMLQVRQLESADSATEQVILPSFLYFPTPEEQAALPEGGTFSPDGKPKVIGRFARQQTATLPGRVVHSAKSWLCHGGIDREGPILPWHSEEIPSAERLSPVEASAHYLGLLRATWNEKFRKAAPFDQQDIVITVPASFDEAAQRLTLEAAAVAGFPRNVRLLEEPQAAFYHWLNLHAQGRELVELLPELREREQIILICDIGGGTSDFSLFAVAPVASTDRIPAIRRLEVSDHLLLGGDNIDLALAHALEKQLVAGGKKLSSGQWAFLLAEARNLKERSLSPDSGLAEAFSIAIPGTGSSLFASTRTASITRAQIESIILEGFFPTCSADDRPTKASSGLKELGLPYAADPGVTRHLAGFLRHRQIDALLFTGGTLTPDSLRDRISSTLASWQPDHPLVVLENDDLDLAVARGAACYGEVLHQPFGRITGGYPHSLYLEIQAKGKNKAPRLVCILPKGFEEHQTVRIDQLNLELVVGKPVRFQPYFSTFRDQDQPGDVIDLDPELFRPLPSLQTGISLQEGLTKPASGRLPVTLETTLNELGLLQVTCVHTPADGKEFRWGLDFNLRKAGTEAAGEEETAPADPGVPEAKLAAAAEAINAVFGKKPAPDAKPRRLIRDLEEILGQRKQDWNLILLRSLWSPLQQGMTLKSRSPDHEATWLNLAGYAIRPGYGADLDPFRIDELWRLQQLGLSHPKEKRVVNQWWILWRRAAGGLDRERQETLLAPLLSQFQNKSADGAELFRFAGSLERVNPETKEQMAGHLARMIESKRPQALSDAIWALGRILNRAPLYAGPDSVVPPGAVEEAFARLKKLDWREPAHEGMNETFARACRLTGLRHHDVDDDLRAAVLARMEESGATEHQLHVVREYVPLELADQASLFGESFPAGLILF